MCASTARKLPWACRIAERCDDVHAAALAQQVGQAGAAQRVIVDEHESWCGHQ
jgi:hypothetical protein